MTGENQVNSYSVQLKFSWECKFRVEFDNIPFLCIFLQYKIPFKNLFHYRFRCKQPFWISLWGLFYTLSTPSSKIVYIRLRVKALTIWQYLNFASISNFKNLVCLTNLSNYSTAIPGEGVGWWWVLISWVDLQTWPIKNLDIHNVTLQTVLNTRARFIGLYKLIVRA